MTQLHVLDYLASPGSLPLLYIVRRRHLYTYQWTRFQPLYTNILPSSSNLADIMGYRMTSKCLLLSVLCAMLAATTLYYTTLQLTIINATLCIAAMCSSSVAVIMLHIACSSPADSHTMSSLMAQYLMYSVCKVGGWYVYMVLVRRSNTMRQSQEQMLKSILVKNKDTQYGQNHDFTKILDSTSISSSENSRQTAASTRSQKHKISDQAGACNKRNTSLRDEYRKVVPLCEYCDFRSYVEQIEKGVSNVLTCDPVVYMATTSGTTGRRKLIPVTKAMRQESGTRILMMATYIMHKTVSMKLGKSMLLAYKPLMSTSACGLPVGPLGYHLFSPKHLPFTTSPPPAFQISNERTSLYIHCVFGLAEREVYLMEGLFGTLVYSMWQLVEEQWQSMCHSIQHGVLPDELNGDDEVLKSIQEHMVPNPKRAQELRLILGDGVMKGVARRIWPGIRCVRMLTSGNFAHQSRIVQDSYMRDVTVMSQIHMSSEGFMGVNLNQSPAREPAPRYTAVPLYGVLEYIHEDDMDLASPDTVYVEELAVGESYEVVMTTPMGLYRYRTGDVITVVSHYNHLPVYVFKQRRGQMLNLLHEKVTEETLAKCVVNVVNNMERSLVGFTATESIHMPTDNSGSSSHQLKHYVLFIELQATDDSKNNKVNDKEVSLFDKELCCAAETYENLRILKSFGEMKVIQLRPGALQKLKSFAIRNTQNQQYKFTYITRNSQHLHFLLQHQLTN